VNLSCNITANYVKSYVSLSAVVCFKNTVHDNTAPTVILIFIEYADYAKYVAEGKYRM